MFKILLITNLLLLFQYCVLLLTIIITQTVFGIMAAVGKEEVRIYLLFFYKS